jgi:hypothetical protein
MLMQEALGRPQVRIWLAIMGTSTLIIGAAYAMVQQSTRLAADDLPLATAQTVKHELEGGAAAVDVVPTVKTDLAADSTVFVIVTDSTQHILASSATLDGQTPLPPAGVFSYTKTHATDHFTWQPKTGVRLATRVMTYAATTDTGFIISGQSLKQAEDRVGTYNLLAFGAWLAVAAWTLLTIMLPSRKLTLETKSTKKIK